MTDQGRRAWASTGPTPRAPWPSSTRSWRELRAEAARRGAGIRAAWRTRSATCCSRRSTWRGSSASTPRARSRPRTGSSAAGSRHVEARLREGGRGPGGGDARRDGSAVAGGQGRRAAAARDAPGSAPPPRWRDLAAALAGARAIALDTESDSLHHHHEKVCLDPARLRLRPRRRSSTRWPGADLAPLGPLLADPAVAKVLHGADYDVTTLKRDFGFALRRPVRHHDRGAHARPARRSGCRRWRAAELGIALSKDSQKDDWSRRPLTPTQERYALADVEHLLALHARLVAKLEAAGRLAWVREESDAVAELARGAPGPRRRTRGSA